MRGEVTVATKILLVDDSVTIQKVVELTFSDAEWEVACVGDGAQALPRLREFRPDVVLLDVILPGENGYEICDRIKKEPALAATPVLLLTGTFEPFDRRRAESVGADGHLTKPFESQVLVAKVQDLLRQARRGRLSADAGYARVINEGEEYTVGSPAAPVAAPPPVARAAAPPPTPAELPPQLLDELARRVAEKIGERVIREVAWEVVPEMAERLVRERIREIEEQEG